MCTFILSSVCFCPVKFDTSSGSGGTHFCSKCMGESCKAAGWADDGWPLGTRLQHWWESKFSQRHNPLELRFICYWVAKKEIVFVLTRGHDNFFFSTVFVQFHSSAWKKNQSKHPTRGSGRVPWLAGHGLEAVLGSTSESEKSSHLDNTFLHEEHFFEFSNAWKVFGESLFFVFRERATACSFWFQEALACSNSPAFAFQRLQARIQDFGQGGQQSFNPKGGLSPKFAQNKGFSLKIAWKLHDFEEILGARGAPLDPLLDWSDIAKTLSSLQAFFWQSASNSQPRSGVSFFWKLHALVVARKHQLQKLKLSCLPVLQRCRNWRLSETIGKEM